MWLSAILLILVLAVYFPVGHFGFIDYDDPIYIYENPHVSTGLNMANLRWAFCQVNDGNWIPLTWLSLMAGCQFFGAAAGPQHLMNLALHAACMLLLFLLLKRTTGASWLAAAAAFLFALHPLHVESVAWITERKDVLSTLFWMLALLSWASYASRPRLSRYLLTLLFFVLGFMSKPMVVTLPAVLLLMDIWPLRRFEFQGIRELLRLDTARRLLWDKIPFVVLAIAMSAITVFVQRSGGAVRSLDVFPLSMRLSNALVTLLVYVYKMFWPSGLAVFYPLHDAPPLIPVIVSGLFVAGVTWLALATLRSRPYLFAGWFWYLITVLPVIGIVQVGEQARADRYTYIPAIGLSVMLLWGVAGIANRMPPARPLWLGLGAAAGLACLIVTWKQVSYWRNSELLFRHALAVTTNNAIAHGCLADAYRVAGRNDEAVAEYRKALAINPHFVMALINYGGLLAKMGKPDEALEPLATAVRFGGRNALARLMFGNVLGMTGRVRASLEHLELAVLIAPENAAAHVSLGKTLGNLGRYEAALAEFREALRLEPGSEEARKYIELTEAVRNLPAGRPAKQDRSPQAAY